MTTIPSLIGHIWRPLHPIDAPAARQLLDDCAFLDGATAPPQERSPEHIDTDTLAAVGNSGHIAAYAWLTRQTLAHEQRVYVDGRVHPDYRGRGIGTYLLNWAEERARTIGADVLRVDYYDRDKDAPKLYERHGFAFKFAEQEREHTLNYLPAVSPPDEFTIQTWADTSPTAFFNVYHAAFRERAGFPGWKESVWVRNMTHSPQFRPSLSLLLTDTVSGSPIAYTLCHVQQTSGYITQMGVVPHQRGNGFGKLILLEALHRFKDANLTTAKLDVNVDNPSAIALYEKLDFRHMRTYHSYQKNLVR